MRRRRVVWAALFGLAVGPAARAQAPPQLIASGRWAYDHLRYDSAIVLLARALAAPDSALPGDLRREASTYLAAAFVLDHRRENAIPVIGQLLAADPRYRPSELTFPPEVTGLFEEVARRLSLVEARLPGDTAIHPGRDAWPVALLTSAPQQIAVEVRSAATRPVRVLYRGWLNDSLVLSWDGLDSAGAAVPTGRYVLVVTAYGVGKGAARMWRWPLDVRVDLPDTLADPSPPAGSLFATERRGVGHAVRTLLAAAGASVAIALGPGLAMPRASPSNARFAVVAAVDVAALLGVLRHPPGQHLETPARANVALVADWRARLDSTRAENRRRLARAVLLIHAGPMIEPAREAR